MELGLELAIPGYRAVGYVERDAYAASALVARMGEEALAPAPIWDDLATFDGEPWRGVVDLVSAGFPCQPFSAAGKQLGMEDERWLWPDIERIVREVRPGRIFLENVPGLVRHGLGAVLGGLAALGYDAEWGLFSAAEVGAPHKRERFFLLARRVPDAECGDLRSEQGWREPERPGTTEPRDVGADVADAASSRCGTGQDARRNFPPGPAALDVWAGVLAAAPEVEPSFCRVADGMAERMEYRADRLRACGNGVVPLQAAAAYRGRSARLDR